MAAVLVLRFSRSQEATTQRRRCLKRPARNGKHGGHVGLSVIKRLISACAEAILMLASGDNAAQTVSPVTVFSSYLRYQTSHWWGCVRCVLVLTLCRR